MTTLMKSYTEKEAQTEAVTSFLRRIDAGFPYNSVSGRKYDSRSLNHNGNKPEEEITNRSYENIDFRLNAMSCSRNSEILKLISENIKHYKPYYQYWREITALFEESVKANGSKVKLYDFVKTIENEAYYIKGFDFFKLSYLGCNDFFQLMSNGEVGKYSEDVVQKWCQCLERLNNEACVFIKGFDNYIKLL